MDEDVWVSEPTTYRFRAERLERALNRISRANLRLQKAGISEQFTVETTTTIVVDNGDVPDGDAAVELIRARRSPACLCNPAFETWVRALKPIGESHA